MVDPASRQTPFSSSSCPLGIRIYTYRLIIVMVACFHGYPSSSGAVTFHGNPGFADRPKQLCSASEELPAAGAGILQ